MTHPITAQVRARKLADAADMGIDHALIDRLVENFYASVRSDPLLAPIFAERIADWPPHLTRMKAFWAAILLGESGFAGNPMLKHVAIPIIESAHFDRWLALFDETLADLPLTDPARAHVSGHARNIARSLLMGIRIHRDGRVPGAAAQEVTHA